MKLPNSGWPAIMLAGVMCTGVSGCKEDTDPGGDGTGTGDDTGGDGSDDNPDSADVAEGMDDDSGCIPGGLGCVCAEGVCSGVLYCVEDTCVQGPEVEFDDGDFPAVLAGLRVPVEVNAEGETIMWTQTGGPPVDLLTDVGTEIAIDIPVDTDAGEVVTLTVEVQLNGVTESASIDIPIREAEFSNVFPDVIDPEELGTVDGLAFNNNGMWVVSNEGFVSLMSPGNNDGDKPIPPAFVQRYDVGGLPAGANFLDGERLLIANTMLAEVQILNTVSGNVTTYFDTVDGGGSLGAANYPLVDRNDGDVMVSNHLDGQVIYYDTGNDDPDDPVAPSTVVLVEGLGVNPNALAFGPEGRGLLYLGVEDAIYRVPYEDGAIGKTGIYLDLAGLCGEPDGIIFDEGQNMWVGCPATNTLFVARYVGGGATESTEVSRSWTDVGTGVSRFANATFGGDGDFAGRNLYWTNLEDATVGTLGVGLQGQGNN